MTAVFLSSTPLPTEVVSDTLHLVPPPAVAMEGHLGQAIHRCVEHRVLAQNVPALIQPFITRSDVTEWRGEFWGKWITSAIQAYRLQPTAEQERSIQQAVADLRGTQTSDGYIGTYTPENRLQRWDIWSRKYTLHGLLAWHEAGNDASALAVARQVADGILHDAATANGGFFRNDMWNGMATSSVLEPMVLLYRRTGEARYLDFCRWIIQQWESPSGPDLIRKTLGGVSVFDMFPKPDPKREDYGGAGHSKAYEMMSCFEGLAELYRITGEPAYLAALKSVHANIRDTEITVIGSGSDWERWCDGRRRQADVWKKGIETCVTVTWIKLSAQLLRLTGDAAYADEIELAVYNALLGAQSPDGSWWAHHAPLAGTKERAPEQCDVPQNCCVANGPRGLLLLPQLAVLAGAEGPTVCLYGELVATVPLAGGNTVRLEQRSDYPAANTVEIRVTPGESAAFPVTLRIPHWSRQTQVTVNGEVQESPTPGTFFPVNRIWRAGDVIKVVFDFSPRVLTVPSQAGHYALARGPVVLARDARLEGASIDEPVAFDFTRVEKITMEPLPAVSAPGSWLAFAVRDADGKELHLCDFASAGNTWTEASRYRVWQTSANP